MADILNQIDDAIRRNAARFDPLGGEAWDQDRVDRWGDGMRVRPASSAGIEEEAVPAEAAVDWIAAALPDRQLTAEQREFLGQVYGSAPTCRGCGEVLTGSASRTRCSLCRTRGQDRVAEAFRTEVLRQGLAPCEIEIDGQPEWLEPLATGGVFLTLEQIDLGIATGVWPDAPPVDAALQPDARCCGDRADLLFGYVGFCTLPAGHFDAHQDDNGTVWTERRPPISKPAPRWSKLLEFGRRLLPGGTR